MMFGSTFFVHINCTWDKWPIFSFQGKLTLKQTLVQNKANTRFGSALANAKDLNKDGYEGKFLKVFFGCEILNVQQP